VHQISLFQQDQDKSISVSSAATLLGVSTATIRNWIKAGYLESCVGGLTKASLENVESTTVGIEKLVSRANKGYGNADIDVDAIQHRFLESCRSEEDGAALGVQYQESLPNSYRNKEGIYYTPKNIVDNLFDQIDVDYSKVTFCDPCCGSGNFLMSALERGVRPENIYGFDTDIVAVEICKSRVKSFTGIDAGENVFNKDFLEYSAGVDASKFDLMFTNPPWGKKIHKDIKICYSQNFGCGKSLDTCALFFFSCLRSVEDDGYLGLLLPESFFNIAVFEEARVKLLSMEVLSFLDYGKSFKGLVTRAQGVVLRNRFLNESNSETKCVYGDSVFSRDQKSFSTNPKSIVNFDKSEEEDRLIKGLYKREHVTLNGSAKWGLGIVTGNNKKHCFETEKEGRIPVLKGADLSGGKFNPPTVFISPDLTKYQQVAPLEMYEAKEKIVYKFISSKLCFCFDDQQRFFLNSANMFVLDKGFPISAQEICKLFSSDFMNWLYQSLFRTHKVLRSDLQALPIHLGYFAKFEKFDEQHYLDYLEIERIENGSYRAKG